MTGDSSKTETVDVPAAVRAPSTARDPRLILVIEGQRPTAQPIALSLRDVELVEIGRGETRELRRQGRSIVLTLPDPRVSGRHARIVPHGDGHVLEDQGSKNGCFVDGERVLRAELEDGDWLRLGEAQFRYRDGGPELRPDGGADGPTPLLRSFCQAFAEKAAQLPRIAAGDVAVLATGETGTGKEVVARAVHDLSGRSGRFVAVNCAALPETLVEGELFGYRKGAFSGAVTAHEGLLRASHGGTLFLDEIGDLRPPAQAALLRALEQREVLPVGETQPVPFATRVVAATNQDLRQRLARGEFRRDLLARLGGFAIELPPLRERREDFGLLVGALLMQVAPKTADELRLGDGVIAALLAHEWPENIRELRNVLHAASLLAKDGVITSSMLPAAIIEAQQPRAGGEAARAALRARLESLLETHAGNLAAVARELGKDRRQVRRWVEMFGIQVERYRQK